MHRPVPLALSVALALAFPAFAQESSNSAVVASGSIAPALTSSNVRDEAVIASTTPLEFTLFSPLSPSEGQLTLLANGNDIGNFLQTADGLHYELDPGFRLPVGPLALELVFEPRGGSPVTLLKATVFLAGGADDSSQAADPRLAADARALIAAGMVDGSPAAGQVGSAPAPQGFVHKEVVQAAATSARREVNGQATSAVTREAALQLGLRYGHEQDGTRLAIGSNFTGTSLQNRATPVNVTSTTPRKFDINDYLLEYQSRAGRLSLGTASTFGHPLLGQSFDNRGLTGTFRFNESLDVALTSQSATPLAGADSLAGANPALGFADSRRRVTAATLGWEAVADQPGTLRLEVTGLTGRTEPARSGTSTSDGLVPMAPTYPGIGTPLPSERGHGAALRLVWAPITSSYRVEGGYARVTSVQADPFGTEQAEHGRKAYYAEGTARVVDTLMDPTQPARHLLLRLRHEFADTGFHSIAAGMLGDVRRTLVGAEGQFNAVQAQLNRSLGRNNVDHNPGLPVLETITDTLNVTIPLARLMDQPASAAVQPQGEAAGAALQMLPFQAATWWPTLQAGWQHNRQKPTQVPEAVVPGLAPAMVTANGTLSAQWMRNAWTWSGGFTYGLRDNREPGFETQDQRSRGVQLQLQWQATPGVNANLGLRRNKTTSSDTGVDQFQNGVDLGLGWQLASWGINGQYSSHGDRDSVQTMENRGHYWQLQASRTWSVPLGAQYRVPLQLSLRMTQQADRSNTQFGGITNQTDQRYRSVGLILSATL